MDRNTGHLIWVNVKSTPSGVADRLTPSGWMASTVLSQLVCVRRMTDEGGITIIPSLIMGIKSAPFVTGKIRNWLN